MSGTHCQFLLERACVPPWRRRVDSLSVHEILRDTCLRRPRGCGLRGCGFPRSMSAVRSRRRLAKGGDELRAVHQFANGEGLQSHRIERGQVEAVSNNAECFAAPEFVHDIGFRGIEPEVGESPMSLNSTRARFAAAKSSTPTLASNRVAFPSSVSNKVLGAWVPTPCLYWVPPTLSGPPLMDFPGCGLPQPDDRERSGSESIFNSAAPIGTIDGRTRMGLILMGNETVIEGQIRERGWLDMPWNQRCIEAAQPWGFRPAYCVHIG